METRDAPPRRPPLRRGLFAIRDAGMQATGVGIMVLGLVIFLILAFGLAKVLGARFGILGWLLFVLIIVSWSMWFAPFVVAGIGVRRAGSPKHRAAAQARLEEQRLKFGLTLPTITRPPAPRAEEERPSDGSPP
jgi:hypothetical protein